MVGIVIFQKDLTFTHTLTGKTTLDPRANIIDVFIWMLFDDVLALALASEIDYVMSKCLCHNS